MSPRRPSVLIVDDDAGMVETLADVFGAKGYDTAVANGGEAAIALVERTPFDLVLMDIQMPGLNGVETMKQLIARVPRMCIVMMTAFTGDDLVQEANRHAAIPVLAKPLELDEVLAVFRRLKASSVGEPPA